MFNSKFLLGTAAAVMMSTSAMAEVSGVFNCKLTNVAANKTLYVGSCEATEEDNQYGTVFTVVMGSGEPFKFAGQRGSTAWMHGGEKTHFTDLPNGAIFKWSTFALVVAE